MRVFAFCAIVAVSACSVEAGRPNPNPHVNPGGVYPEISTAGTSSTGGDPSSSFDSSSTTGTSLRGSSGGTSLEEAAGTTEANMTETTGLDPSTSDPGDPGDPGSSGSTGTPESSGEDSSTGEPEPPAPMCGDGVCDPAERAPCWGWADGKWSPSFCADDCMKDPACVAVLDCGCTPEAAAVKSWCFAEPLPACSATAPGGACEVSTALAFYMWNAKCG